MDFFQTLPVVTFWTPNMETSRCNLSARNFLGKKFTHIAQVNSAFYLNWTENEYQLRLGSES